MKLWIFLALLAFVVHLNAAQQKDIEQKWQATSQYKEYLALQKSWNEEEAEKLQFETISEIANEVLKLYVKDFKDKREIKMEARTAKLPFQLKTLLADAYIKWRNLLSEKHKNEKDLNSFVYKLSSFIDSIYKSKWVTEKRAISLEEKFPELKWTPYMELLISIWESYDEIDEDKKIIDEDKKIIDEDKKIIEEWDKIIKQLQSI